VATQQDVIQQQSLVAMVAEESVMVQVYAKKQTMMQHAQVKTVATVANVMLPQQHPT